MRKWRAVDALGPVVADSQGDASVGVRNSSLYEREDVGEPDGSWLPRYIPRQEPKIVIWLFEFSVPLRLGQTVRG